MRTSTFLSLTASLFLASCAHGGGSASLAQTHVHGLALDRGDSSRLYIATHHGLHVLAGDKDLTLIGRSRDDFMGFSPHPTDRSILFSSGHPQGGGNLGFLKSEDGGKAWQKVSNGNPGGPADFHAMMVHPANPNYIYGWYRLRVHRSSDQGRTWEILANQPPEVLSFAGDAANENVIYIGSIGDLLRSTDRGETWESMTDALSTDVVFDIEVEPESGALFLATRDRGIVKLSKGVEGGVVLEDLGVLPGEDTPQYLALDPKNPQTLYTFTKAHALYKSSDGGRVWLKLL